MLMKERDFSRKLRNALRSEGFSVRPVETGGTNVGFPDLFVTGHGVATFIEVKSRPAMTVAEVNADSDSLLGPGQRQFAREFAVGTSEGNNEGKRCLVIACCSDGVLAMSVDTSGSLQEVCVHDIDDMPCSRWITGAVVSGYYGETICEEDSNGN